MGTVRRESPALEADRFARAEAARLHTETQVRELVGLPSVPASRVLGPDAATADRVVLDAKRRALSDFVLATVATAGRLESFALAWSMTDATRRDALAASVAEEVDTLLQVLGATEDLAESLLTHGAAQRRLADQSTDTPSRRLHTIALQLATEQLRENTIRHAAAMVALDDAARVGAPPELRAALDAAKYPRTERRHSDKTTTD